MATGERRRGHVGAARAVLTTLLATPVALLATLLATVIAALLVAGPTPGTASVSAQSKSFTIDALESVAEMRTDGSMLVTERVTYDYDGGPFEFGIRSFERNLDAIGRFTATDDQGPLEVIAPADSISGQWEWKLRQPTSDATVTYTLTYFIEPRVELGRDVSFVNWQALGTQHDGVGEVNVRLRLPVTVVPATPETPDDDVNVMRGWVHGPSNGTVELQPAELIARVRDVPAGQFVELHVAAPATTFNVKGTDDLLPRILADERRYVADREQQQEDRRNGWLFSSLLLALGAIGAGALWLVGGREAKSTEVQGDYWREPLDDPPAVALCNLQRGSVDAGPTVAGTLVDLAQRGYIRIVGEREPRLGKDKVVHRFSWLGKPLGPDVLPYERDLLELVFRGSTQTTSDELADWGRDHQTEAKRLLDEVTGGVKAEYRRRGYADESRRALVGLLLGICAGVAIASAIVKQLTGYGFGWWGVAVAAAIFGLGTRLLSNRNRASVEAAAKAEGLKRYLKDFSRLEDAPVGHLILWERYLVFAVVLGVSAELVEGLASRLPQVMADPGFGVWYVGTYGRFDGFDRIETTSGSSFVAASTPNSTGSGGGFSGGGGGGIGGGGFGAR